MCRSKSGMVRVRGRKPWVMYQHILCAYSQELNINLSLSCFCCFAEQSILAQYEIERKFDEEALCAAIDSLTTDDIICPICQKSVRPPLSV